MCQILQTKNDVKNIIKNKDIIKDLLCEKGGESFSFFVDDKVIYTNLKNFNEDFDNFISDLKGTYNFVFFSRQKPEMEEDVEPAPYFLNGRKVWLHGTISNQKEIEEKLKRTFKVDSETLAFYDEVDLKGVYTGYILPDNKWVYNGIGLWKTPNWIGTTPNLNKLEDCISLYEPANNANKLNKCYVSFSGGMDIVFSTFAVMNGIKRVKGSLDIKEKMEKIDEYILVYFDYDANAKDNEINAMKKFVNFVNKIKNELNININFTYKIINVKEIFKSLSSIINFQSKLMNKESKGDIEETENNSAYVPYRNTIFGILLGALIDEDLEKEDFKPFILYGLNLTEMGVYVDNTEIWANSLKNIVNYGGKHYKKTEVITPFVDTTKTNMIKFMIKQFGKEKTNELLDIAFSCYYPENGKPCGKCGSCILRQKALEA